MVLETIIYEVRNKIAYVTLNRPKQGNALNETMHRELLDAWGRINADDSVWGVLVQGAGKDFCLGEDAHEIAEAYRKGGKVNRWVEDEAWLRKESRPPIFGWPQPMNMLPSKPLVTVVHGRCQGSGMMFVGGCAFTIAADDAEFSLPNVNQGTAPIHEILILTRIMARAPIMRLALLGKNDKLTAERARELGLVIETRPAARLQERVGEIMDMLVNQAGPLAVRAGYTEWWRSFDLPSREKFEMAHTVSMELSVASLDFKEGPRAFAEKRKPRWNAG